MKADFYDVKAHAKVTTDVLEKVTYGEDRLRYAFKGKTEDGRSLTLFVSKEKYDAAVIEAAAPAAPAAAPKKKCGGCCKKKA